MDFSAHAVADIKIQPLPAANHPLSNNLHPFPKSLEPETVGQIANHNLLVITL
jgi:hypothetical protein